MKVTREMVHPDLQGGFGMFSVFTSLMKRRWFIGFTNWLTRTLQSGKDIEGLDCGQHHLTSNDGEWQIRVRTYRPVASNSEKLPAVLYIHGGGYIGGSPESTAPVIERFLAARPCVVISPDYRKSFTKPFPAGFDDCYQTLLWARDNAEELGIRNDQFIIAGHSAGGGLTAAVTLKARDTGDVKVAFQMPIYPMIDDSQPDDPKRHIEVPVWDTELNRIGWNAYLADLHRDGTEVPAYAAPARNDNYQGFPPTITFVGTLEPFYWETLDYVQALRNADVEVAFKEYPDCFHGFDFFSDSGISEDAKQFTFDQFSEFYDRCFDHR